MRYRSLFSGALFFMFSLSTFAASSSSSSSSDMKGLDTFDVYAAPLVGVSSGTYKADTVDEGSVLGLHYGARLGFKVGPILLGGEFAMVTASTDSTKGGVSNANRQKYSADGRGTITAVGVNLGLSFDRVAIWANYYPASDFDVKYDELGTKYAATYKGNAYSAEINFRVWNRLYLGAFAVQREYSKYSTTIPANVVTDADLDPKLKSLSYGLSVSYLFPLSEFKKLSKSFPTL